MKPKNNTMFITGATSGIGRALAEEFYRRGNQVIVTGRRQKLLDELTTRYPGMRGIYLDVRDPVSIKEAVRRVYKQFPAINVLLNNAGIAGWEDLTTDAIDTSRPRSIVQTNILGLLEVTSAFLPILRGQPASTIITTTSGLAFVPFFRLPTYCATKAFLHSWVQSVRRQLRNTSVEVLELVPPYVQTELGGPEQATDIHAMPLSDYIAEVMPFFDDPNQSGDEILVKRVETLRHAGEAPNYKAVFDMNNER